MESPCGQFCKTDSRSSWIPSRRLAVIETHNERRKSFTAAELLPKLARGVFPGNLAHAHTIVEPLGRIILLNEDRRIGSIQAIAHSLCIGRLAKRADLHGEETRARIHSARKNFQAYGDNTGSHGIDFACRGEGQINDAVLDERAAVRNAHGGELDRKSTRLNS